MTDFQKIFTEFAELVGYRNENEITLPPALNQSDSGLYVNDLGGVDLLSIEKSAFLKADLTKEKTVAEYLAEIYNSELQNLINAIILQSNELFQVSSIKYQKYIYSPSVATEPINNKKYFVGLVFTMNKSSNLHTLIKKISIKLKENQIIKLYLYDTQLNEPIKTFDIDFTDALSFQAFDLTDFILKYQDKIGSDKTYLLGYYEYDSENPLPDHQLNDDNTVFSQSFAYENVDYDFVVPITVEKSSWQYDAINNVYLMPNFNYLNSVDYVSIFPQLFQECDYTQIMIDNKLHIAKILQVQLAKRIIEDCNFSKEFNAVTESNRTNWNNLILHFNNLLNGYEFQDAQGNSGHKKGLIVEFINILEGIDNECFPRRRNLVL